MFIIVAEGTVTEQEYFPLFNQDLIVRVKCLTNSGSLSPDKALKRAIEYVGKEKLMKGDEVWVVVDKDEWDEKHFAQLHAWAQEKPNRGFALSNPKFEYWLLLHFEDAKNVTKGADCDKRLARHFPNYNKHIKSHYFTLDRIKDAINRAKKRDSPPCTDWPRKSGSTVYKLVEKILEG